MLFSVHTKKIKCLSLDELICCLLSIFEKTLSKVNKPPHCQSKQSSFVSRQSHRQQAEHKKKKKKAESALTQWESVLLVHCTQAFEHDPLLHTLVCMCIQRLRVLHSILALPFNVLYKGQRLFLYCTQRQSLPQYQRRSLHSPHRLYLLFEPPHIFSSSLLIHCMHGCICSL